MNMFIGGTGVANYLKDHLHEFILAQPEYRCDGKHIGCHALDNFGFDYDDSDN